jgi:diguanylate cyclase (GGDEF)-like protein
VADLQPHQLEVGVPVVDFLSSGAAVDLTTCDREPIHLSGHIQPHGLLLVVDELDLRIRQASDNVAGHLPTTAKALLGAPLTAALGYEPVERLRVALGQPRAAGEDPLTCHLPGGAGYELTWHRVGDQVVLELEPADDPDALSMSTLFAHVRRAMRTLETTDGVLALCQAAAAEVKHVTGYDRVMVYRFHPDGHGEVVAEECEADMDPFLGLNYPASDIPRQARKLYLLNRLRVIADVGYAPVPLLSSGGPDEPATDLSLAALRSVSPFHLSYLTNMGVGATLTISLMRGTQLWGMLACHHRTPKRIDAQLRAACRLLGQTFSLQLIAQESYERTAYRAELAEVEVQVVARMASADSLAGALLDANLSSLRLTAADGMVARIDGRTVQLGAVLPPAALAALLQRVSADEEPVALVCDDLPSRFPELAPYAEHAVGVLAMPLSAAYEDYIMWFRRERALDVWWAGSPDKPVSVVASGPDEPHGVSLGPRTSFEAWLQDVRGRCIPWDQAEIDTARGLASSVPELLLARARDRLAHLALHDTLTGLPNRGLLVDRTAQALTRRQRAGGEVAMMFIDLDRFKLVNDSLGHAAGDDLLRQAADRLSAAVRESDTVARIGGDEFVVLCETVSAALAHQLAERIVRAFRAPFVLDGHQALVTASIGVAVTAAGRRTSPADLLSDADTAMYRAKHSGRDASEVFTEQMRVISLRRIEIETSLRPALEHGDLQVHFQPIHTHESVLTGFEALARWPLPGHGMVPPSEFIPIAESTGLMGMLTDWVLEQGLAALAGWRVRRPDLDLTLAVNMTASQMTNDRLRTTIDRTLARHRLPPGVLCLEITESALITDDDLSHRFLHGLREQGVRLSIDDFGTGFSSLSYLAKLPVHELKIDRAFTTGLPDRQADVTIVASVVGLAHQLGMQALAEGVETDEQMTEVRRLGCDLVQGYLLGRPMSADEIDVFLLSSPLSLTRT